MLINKIARIISLVLGPHVWMPVILAVSIFKTGLEVEQIRVLFPALLTLLVIIPLVALQVAVKLKIVSAWDLPKRRQRYGMFGLFILCCLISGFVVYHFGNPLFWQITLSLFVLSVVLALVTFFWKISVHASLNTAGVLVVNYLWNWEALWLFLLIPAIFWSRLYLKRHTWSQLLAGTFVSAGVILGCFKYFYLI